MNDVLPNRVVDIHLPDYPDVPVEEVEISVENTSSEQQVGHFVNTSHDHEVWEEPWEGPENATDEVTYNITLTARHGKLGLVGWWEVQRLPPEDSGKRDLSAQYNRLLGKLVRGVMYGQLDAEGDKDAFEAEYVTCDVDETPYVTFDVRGLEGSEDHDVDLFVQDEEGNWHNDTGPGADPTVTDTPSGDTYAYDVDVVKDDPGTIGYEIRYQTECHGDGDNDDDPDADLHPSHL